MDNLSYFLEVYSEDHLSIEEFHKKNDYLRVHDMVFYLVGGIPTLKNDGLHQLG